MSPRFSAAGYRQRGSTCREGLPRFTPADERFLRQRHAINASDAQAFQMSLQQALEVDQSLSVQACGL